MEQQVDRFNQARDYLSNILPAKIELFLSDIYNPISKYNIIKKTTNIIIKEMIEIFPNEMIPENHLPKFRFRIHEEHHEVEVGIQQYYNIQKGLTYLGTTDIEYEIFDFYLQPAYVPQHDYIFIARYGNKNDQYITGATTAEEEYQLGQHTPLACAYALALEDNFIG